MHDSGFGNSDSVFIPHRNCCIWVNYLGNNCLEEVKSPFFHCLKRKVEFFEHLQFQKCTLTISLSYIGWRAGASCERSVVLQFSFTNYAR